MSHAISKPNVARRRTAPEPKNIDPSDQNIDVTNLSSWRRVSSTSASEFFHLRSPLDRTRLFPALGSRLHSPPSSTRNPAALGSQLHSPPVRCSWICVQPIISTHENASHRKPKAQQSMRRHFFAQSSMSCMQQSRRRSFTHFEASLRGRQPLKRRISAHKFA